MESNTSIKLLIFMCFLTAFAIEDILNQKIPNFLLLGAFLVNIMVITYYNENLWNILIVNFPFFLISLYFWKKEYIGGGDLKSLIIILNFLRSNSDVSFFHIEIQDIFEFFVFFSIFFYIKKPNLISSLFEFPSIYYLNSQEYAFSPYFLIAYIFTIIF